MLVVNMRRRSHRGPTKQQEVILSVTSPSPWRPLLTSSWTPPLLVSLLPSVIATMMAGSRKKGFLPFKEKQREREIIQRERSFKLSMCPKCNFKEA